MQPDYMVSIYDDQDAIGAIRFSFVPKSVRRVPADTEAPSPAPQYVVSVQGHGDEAKFHWIEEPAQEETRKVLEGIARQRATARNEWLERLRRLVETVREWAEDLGWATRVVDKKLEDAEIGNYKAPGLLLQRDTVRLFLEPVARDAPGTEGIVDLYLMPSYDDIASFYYYNNRWNVQYVFQDEAIVAKVREAEAKSLTKPILRKVLDEMKAHAG
jgi:hypothetical protein